MIGISEKNVCGRKRFQNHHQYDLVVYQLFPVSLSFINSIDWCWSQLILKNNLQSSHSCIVEFSIIAWSCTSQIGKVISMINIQISKEGIFFNSQCFDGTEQGIPRPIITKDLFIRFKSALSLIRFSSLFKCAKIDKHLLSILI